MIWAMIFVACMPDALHGPECHELAIDGWPTFSACEVNRPFVRRMLRGRFDAEGWGAATIDAGRCAPIEPEPPGIAM